MIMDSYENYVLNFLVVIEPFEEANTTCFYSKMHYSIAI